MHPNQKAAVVKYLLSACLAGFILLAALLFVHIAKTATDFATPTLKPDLAFFYSCPPPDHTMTDDLLADLFLKKHGFQVQDVGELQRELAISNSATQFITATDMDRRMITISAAPNDTVDHNVVLYTEPPTIRDAALENDLLAFAADDLKCRVAYVTRDVNAANAKGLYDSTFAVTEASVIQFHDARFSANDPATKPTGDPPEPARTKIWNN